MTPDEYCRERAARTGSSFYYAFRYLPEERRRAITAFYAFCREADDVVDEPIDRTVARAKLAWWRQEIRAMLAGHPSHPVTRAIAPHVSVYGIPSESFDALLDGMAEDLEHAGYHDFSELERYCYLVAGSVGEVSARIFGFDAKHREAVLAYARTLGEALQLINILRDVGEDARRGRLYLPRALLDQYGVSPDSVLRREASTGLTSALEALYRRAIERYEEALRLLPPDARRAQRPGLIMGAIYRTLAEEIRREGFCVLKQRIALTPIRKLWIAWKTATFA
ncbi:MAG: presqualene diphosphate synthase HpnD [Casimicrobiaceae bacterium]|nr:presqualene diphosphate synthase HpnD [Casimicrobiaceae bacterium]MCX8097859.1 presqualene diphosphate synthase HpnD [Casimicrobiaceae bacterium]MDW8311350.1 presqualene diphosphate synthase HpnD [Burkholderiales bacterium]